MVKKRITVEVKAENLEGFAHLCSRTKKKSGEEWTLTDGVKKMLKDYFYFREYMHGNKYSFKFSRSRKEDVVDSYGELKTLSVELPGWMHSFFKLTVENDGLKLNHVIRGLLEIWGDCLRTKDYNFKKDNIILEYYKKNREPKELWLGEEF